MTLYSDALPAHNAESLLVHFRRVELLKEQATDFKSVSLDSGQLSDLEMLLSRAFYPLEGYMCRADYERVLSEMRLTDDTLWPLPVCLAVDEYFAKDLEPGESVAIRDAEGFMLAVLTVAEVWQPDLAAEAQALWGGNGPAPDKDAPPVWYVGGRVEGLHFPQRYDFTDLRLTPAETHRYFSQKGWRKVISVQAGRPLHRADKAMLERMALDHGASLFLSPVLSPSMYSSVDHFTLVRCFQRFTDTLSRNMAKLCLTPWFERGLGPKSALLRAVVNKNYGCTHMLVWDRNNHLVGSAPRPPDYAARFDLLKEYEAETGVAPVREQDMVFDVDTRTFAPGTRPQDEPDDHEAIVELLVRGEPVPEHLTLPGVLEELKQKHKPRSAQGFTLFFTGLSGAGKSTLAKVLFVKLLEMSQRPVTLLDGDIVRHNLSSELNFSKEHRNLNVTRIGFVASEIVKNGGVAICAPIAPYPESRREVRRMIEEHGGFIEIHVSTPLEVCEQRDRKGIYAKARAGIIKGLTGVDDPYVEPENPELSFDTTELTPNEAAHEIMMFLSDKSYVRA